MKNKLILDINRKTVKSGLVRLTPEAFKLVQQIQFETGLTASKIVSEFVKFGSKNYIFVFDKKKERNGSYKESFKAEHNS